MNTIQKGLLAISATAIAAGLFSACDEDDTFDINSPSWLESRIDSIAASKAEAATGDTTRIELSNTTVGAKDNSAAWWTEFSDAVAIPSGKMLTFEFDNFGSGANNYNNWNLCVANSKNRDATDTYKEYFVLRSDAYGWGGAMGTESGYTYEAGNISTNYAEVAAEAGAEDQWAFFREKMQGAHVVMTVQHVTAGYVYMTATMTATDGTVLVESYFQTCSPGEDIYAFLVCDASHFENLTAMLTPATIVITESLPARLELSNAPAFLTLGDSAYHQGIAAKVYFEDGTSADVDTLDLSFIAPDLATTGQKTVTVIYNKTSSGNYCAPIYATYSLAITDFRSIRVENVATFKYWCTSLSTDTVAPLNTGYVKVYGVSSDGSEDLIDNSAVKFSSIRLSDGVFTAEYQGLKATGTVEKESVANGLYVGLPDFSSTWWTVFSPDEQVKVGQTVTKKLQLRSNALSNWNSPTVIVRTAALAEYAVVRTDNFGWGAGYDNIVTPESNWDWDVFAARLDCSVFTISVTNNGSTIDVKYSVVDSEGDTHYQNYTGIAVAGTAQVDADDVYISLTTEGAYMCIAGSVD